MKASIIITTYKRNEFLLKAIDSCINQDFAGETEIIVIDDSGKGTEHQLRNQEILEPYFAGGDILYIALERNSGACFARNAGAAYAQGEYLFFLDDDDEFLPDKLSYQIAFMEEHPEYDGHASAFLKKRNGENFPSTDGQPIIGDLKNYLMYGNVYTPMFCVKKDVYLKIGGFQDIPKFQDMYFIAVFLSLGKKMYADTKALFIQNDHAGERISTKSVMNAHIAVSKFQNLADDNKHLFSKKEWNLAQTRFEVLIATTYYSNSYANRIRSIKYWLRCIKFSGNIKYLYPIVKSVIPNGLIKFLEGKKATDL